MSFKQTQELAQTIVIVVVALIVGAYLMHWFFDSGIWHWL
jgi:hypothetical protein